MKNDRDMMKTKFEEFVNEQFTLTIEDSMDDFEMPDSADAGWELEYNVSDLYNNYQKNKNTDDFIKKYKNRLLGKKNDLINIGKVCWNDLVALVKEKHEDDILPYLDKIYDWADKYGVRIISK
jgi:hypothetical protein